MKKQEKGFEEYITELESIVESLENGRLTIERSVEQYETAMELVKRCNEILTQSKNRISVIRNAGGQIIEEDFMTDIDGDDDDEF